MLFCRKKKGLSRLTTGNNADFSRSISMPADKIANLKICASSQPNTPSSHMPSSPELE